MAAPMLATTVEATLVNSPNKSRLRNLSMKISAMGDELSQEKQARADAVELKLKVHTPSPPHLSCDLTCSAGCTSANPWRPWWSIQM